MDGEWEQVMNIEASTDTKRQQYTDMLLNLAIILVFLLLCVLCMTQPRMSDDYGYASTVRSSCGFVSYVTYLYMNASGRCVINPMTYASSFNSLFPLIGLVTGVALFLICYLVVAIGLGRPAEIWRRDRFLFVLTLGVMCFGVRLAETAFWQVAAFVYVWPLLAALYFVYLISIADANHKKSAGRIVLVAVLGLIAGSSQEQVAIVLIAYLAWTAIGTWRSRTGLSAAQKVGMAAVLLGAIVLFAAPGNYARMGVEGQTKSGWGWLVWTALDSYVFSPHAHVYFLLYFVGLSASYLSWVKDGVKQSVVLAAYRARIPRFLLWSALAFVALAPFVITKVMLGRTTVFTLLLLLIGLFSLYNEKDSDSHLNYFTRAVSAILLVAMIFMLGMGMRFRTKLNSQLANRESIIRTHKSEGKLDVVVPPLDTESLWSLYTFVSDISADVKDSNNEWVASYYGLHSIRLSDGD